MNNKPNHSMSLLDIACHFRALQLYAHNAHNVAKGPVFLSDHEYLGELYPIYEKEYDSFIERCMGTSENCELKLTTIIKKVYNKIKNLDESVKENKVLFQNILKMEQELCEMCNMFVSYCESEGTKQLVGEAANQSEMRQYILKQRLK